MKNKIDWLKIQNFKSIKELELKCDRINLFIGKPNVGKSNLLEAISLLAQSANTNDEKWMGDFLNYNSIYHLFHFSNIKSGIKVQTNLGEFRLAHFMASDMFESLTFPSTLDEKIVDRIFGHNTQHDRSKFVEKIVREFGTSVPVPPGYFSLTKDGRITTFPNALIGFSIKKYEFRKHQNISKDFPFYLRPPFGENLFSIISQNESLGSEIGNILTDYGLEFVVSASDKKFLIQRKKGVHVDQLPYDLLADTLQRYMFHLAAIQSNSDSNILFEEPENHSYPPYIRDLALKIVASKENQFFITSHSPYLVNTILENTGGENVGLFVTYFEDYQTKVKKLSEDEIQNVLNYGVDLFFNLDSFLD